MTIVNIFVPHLLLLLLLLSSTTATPLSADDPLHDVDTRDTPANSSVCYEDLGCFTNNAPFNNAGNELPQSPDIVNTTFMLYTRDSDDQLDFEVLSYTNESDSDWSTSTFNPHRMTRVVVHGFSNSGFEPWAQAMKDAFLQIEDANVIVVDWKEGALMPLYPTAVANTRLVGRQLRMLLVRLVEEAGLQLTRLHLVGHSLGAHISGYAGRDLNGQIHRITALDPAGPLFDHFNTVLDIDKTDAMFVDVVHSNAKPLSSGGAGLYRQIGHLDFYVNGGKTQPGCRDGFSAILDMFKTNLADAVACSHGRSHAVFIESITSECAFTTYPCHSFDGFLKGVCLECGDTGCSELGLYSDQHTTRGTQYLMTRDHSPFCGFHYSVTIETATAGRDTTGQLSVQLSGSWGTTDYLSVTEEKEDLKQGMSYGGVVVASTEVGIIERMSIRYTKASGWLGIFGGGRDSFNVDTVTVMSGESGMRYTFCLREQQLRHEEEVSLTLAGRGEC